jgi:hypothetical protein
MEKKPTLHFINFNTEQKKFIGLIINQFGTGQHPLCSPNTFDGFAVSYLKEIMGGKKFQKAINHLSADGKKLLNEIYEKLL